MHDSHLRPHIARLSAAQLSENLKKAVQTLNSLDARRVAARDELGKATARLKAVEAALLVYHNGHVPEDDEDLGAAEQAVEDARKALAALADEQGSLKQLVAVYRAEEQARNARLDKEVRQACADKWSGRARAHLQVAREAVASAIVAEAHRQTLDPRSVNLELFCSNVLNGNHDGNSRTVYDEVKKIVERDQAEARKAIVARDKLLG